MIDGAPSRGNFGCAKSEPVETRSDVVHIARSKW
jgi:hypothetical protein